MDWARILAYVPETVDQELLGRNEYLAAENRILKGATEWPAEAVGRRARRAGPYRRARACMLAIAVAVAPMANRRRRLRLGLTSPSGIENRP